MSPKTTEPALHAIGPLNLFTVYRERCRADLEDEPLDFDTQIVAGTTETVRRYIEQTLAPKHGDREWEWRNPYEKRENPRTYISNTVDGTRILYSYEPGMVDGHRIDEPTTVLLEEPQKPSR